MKKFEKEIVIVLDSLKNDIFEKYNIEFNFPASMAMNYNQELNYYIASLKYFNYKNEKGDYYLDIKLVEYTSVINNLKECRYHLVEILKNNNVEIIEGKRMSLKIKIESLLFQFRHLISSKNSINKFNL